MYNSQNKGEQPLEFILAFYVSVLLSYLLGKLSSSVYNVIANAKYLFIFIAHHYYGLIYVYLKRSDNYLRVYLLYLNYLRLEQNINQSSKFLESHKQ
jgi:hypothetical protein